MSKPMMIDDNGVIRPMTEEEIKAIERFAAQLPPPEPTPEEQIAELEEALALLLSGVTE